MIDVTVKTLDSQNHAFTLEDDITVKDFKEHITGTVDIPVDLQRLIYCGRVLQDDKRLSDYDVNGKVIHLVQRAPPSTTQRSSSSSQNDNRSSGDFMSSPRIQYRQAQFHGNPMYVGSVSIPAEVLESNDWPIPQLSSSTANSHLAIVRRMLDQANRVIDGMDNADTPSNADENTTVESEQTTSTVNTETTSSSPPTTTATTTTSTTHITTTTTTPPQVEEQQQQQQQQDNAEQPAASTSNESTTENDSEGLVPRQLAELLEKLLTTQDRLSPYIRERILLTSDGSGSSTKQSDTTAEQNQRIIDGVTECFHFLSHAQHALSDMSVDMQQPPPRTVRCRPMMIPPSTIIQAGMPIQVEAHISLHGQSDSSNADSEDGSNNDPPRESTDSTVPRTFSPTPESDETGETQSENAQQQATPGQNQSDNGFGSLFNFPSNVEVVMEMGPQAPRVWSFSTNGQGQTTSTSTGNNSNNNNNSNTSNNNANANGNNNSNNNSGSGSGGRTTTGGAGLDSFPWSGAPSPDIIRNLIQAVAGYMAQGSNASATSTSTSTPTSTNQANSTSSNNSTPTIGLLRHRTMTVALGNNESTPGQTSQSRANTDTHPTTSTQTRTTPRTHVFHQHAQALGVAQSLDFDPFLPCNSPHLRRGQQAQNNTTSTQTGQNAFSTSDNTSPLQAGTIRFGSGNGSGITGIGGIGGISGMSPRFATVAGVQVINASSLRNQSLSDAINEAARTSHRTSRSIPLNRFLLSRGVNIGQNRVTRRRSIIHAVYALLSKLSISDWFRILNGCNAPLTEEFGRSLRQMLRGVIPSPTNFDRQIVQLFIDELIPNLESTFENEDAFDNNMRPINLSYTIEQLIFDRGEGIVRSILNEESFSGIVAAIRTLAVDMTRLIRFCLRGQSGFDRVIARFATTMSRGTNESFRQWIIGTVVEWFCRFAQNIPVTTDDSIAAVVRLHYKETPASTTAQTLSMSSPDQSSAQQELEPMEIDGASSEQPDNDPLALEEGEDVPTTFPGHEQLLPEWVPIIARDGSRQRRQLQLGITGESVTNLSDAYLSTMPTKRRKLVEQQKPTLLTNTTSNNSPIPASMERLVRDSVERAGIEEVDGAASAVAADPTVRRAFGQAIRECLNPRRFQSSDFPDSLRFPNASRLFTESDRSSQQ